MTALSHSHFGEIQILDGTAELTATFGGHEVRIDLSVDDPEAAPEAVLATLDRVADLTPLDTLARAAILADASNAEGSANLYVEHHLAELGAAALALLFGPRAPADVTPALFLSKLRLIRAGLYPASPDARIVLDYSIDPKLTQYLLAVSFDAAGEVASVEFES